LPDAEFDCGESGEPVANGPGRDSGCLAVQVRPGGCGGGGGVGDLAGRGGGDLDAVDPNPELVRHHLGDLDVQPLPHLGPAMVQLDRAVGIDVDERTGLVEVRQGEGYPELHGRQGKAFLHDRARPVEGCDGFPTPAIVRCPLQGLDDRRSDVVLDALAVGRVVATRPIEVPLAHVQRIKTQPPGYRIERPFDAEHPLRPAEAPEGGVGDGVRLHAARLDPHIAQVIAIVRVEHGAVANSERKVGGIAATGGVNRLIALYHSGAVEGGGKIDAEIVAFARHRHVVVAVEAQLAWPTGHPRRQSSDCGPLARLTLLAAEAAAHAAHLAHDRAVGQAEDARHDMLDLRRVLGRRQDEDLAVLSRRREGNLSFEIEVLLPTDEERPLDAAGGPVERA
jgi:hypothetical protein